MKKERAYRVVYRIVAWDAGLGKEKSFYVPTESHKTAIDLFDQARGNCELLRMYKTRTDETDKTYINKFGNRFLKETGGFA